MFPSFSYMLIVMLVLISVRNMKANKDFATNFTHWKRSRTLHYLLSI